MVIPYIYPNSLLIYRYQIDRKYPKFTIISRYLWVSIRYPNSLLIDRYQINRQYPIPIISFIYNIPNAY